MARIAMLVSNRYDPDPRVDKEARALAAAGHRVTVYALDRQRELAERAAHGGIRLERIRPPLALPRNMVGARAGVAYFHTEVRRRLLREPVEVVHCHDQDTCAVGLWWKERGATRAGLPRGRFVFDAHDLYWTWALLPDPDARWRKGLAWALRRADRRYAGRADLLVTVTQGTGAHPGVAEIYQEWGCHPVVIWNAPPPPTDPIPPLPSRFTVGYLGNVREPAMFENLVAAVALLEPAERPALRVAGSGRSAEHVQRILAAAATRLGLEVEQTGGFSASEIPSLMAACSLQYCVYPTGRGNIDRAMPVKMLESVAYGRRVIGNADSLMGDWIHEKAWGWTVRENDPAGLASALRQAAARCDAERNGLPALAPPPLWPEQGRRLVEAYEALLS